MSSSDCVRIVLGSYNGEKYLAEQLDSILSGTYQNIHIEISDDGSTDRTLEISQKYVDNNPGRVEIHKNQTNMGYVKNFLYGLKRSKEKYTMFCDQDDIWMPDKVQVTLDKMKRLEQEAGDLPMLVFTDAMLYNGETKEEMGSFHKTSHLDTDKTDLAHLFMENKCIGCTVMVNSHVISYVKEIPEQVRVHDWWLALICASFGKIGYVSKPTLEYRQHSGNMIGSTSFFSYFMNRIRSFKEQKQVLRRSILQGRAFYEMYGNQLEGQAKEVAKEFSTLATKGFFGRRRNCIHFGFLKSGLTRNVGLFILI